MKLTVNGASLYCYTGGRPFQPEQPSVVFIHGVLNDHSVWILQSRYFAHHGWNVLAVDLPGHCRSGGEAPASVEQAARAMAGLLDAAGIAKAALVGHSWGSLIALQTAADLGARISHVALVGTAYPMKVSATLIENSLNDPMSALKMVNVFSRATLAPPPSALGPGTWVYGAGMALGRRVLASNPNVNLFHRGFVACDRYRGGEEAMARVRCPVLFLLGRGDQMTAPAAARSLIEIAERENIRHAVAWVPVGHHQMTEAPDETLTLLWKFLNAPA